MKRNPAVLSLLIVDDEEEFALALASRLELRGMRVRCAFSGEQGLAALREEPADVLLLDMRMPGMSGVGVLRALRRDKAVPGASAMPVIIVSGHADMADIEEAEKIGIQGYV
ncbi:response regulator, partial [Desulfovibrio sp. OttesenSCG-928-A18]|nr:response regulator [Desulfovibrio sp. OttesenSCG-928-A18]